MDLIKIGKHIADCRKTKNITQEQLAEKLNITDRAVSKWERGLSLPNADKMLDLCAILEIDIQELLNGEKIDMKDYKKKMETLLVELSKQDEAKNKKIMANMWITVITVSIFYFAVIELTEYALKEGLLYGIIMSSSTLIYILICLYALKLEVDAGYYECKNCHNQFKASYLIILFAPHVHSIRHLKCPKCGQKTWAKKVMKKDSML